MPVCGDCRYYLQHHCFSKPPIFAIGHGWCRPTVDPKNPVCALFEYSCDVIRRVELGEEMEEVAHE